MICGNKNALGKEVFDSINLSKSEIDFMRQEGRLQMELWNE
jgi:hypothetical protein